MLTTFYPVTYFAQRIAQETVEVICPLPDAADPIYWMPEASAIQQYQSADLILINGANFEQWIDKVTLPSSNWSIPRNLSKTNWCATRTPSSTSTALKASIATKASTGIRGWIPSTPFSQSQEIKAAIAKRWPEHKATFAKGYASLETDLQDLHARFQTFAKSWGTGALAASHPAYNYLAKRYKLQDHQLRPGS